MADTLKLIRDLTIVTGIYLYFIAWVYVNFYYQQFGISTASIKIDYSSYLMYSYNVITSASFLYWVKVFVVLVLIRLLVLFIIDLFRQRYTFFEKINTLLLNNLVMVTLKKMIKQYSLLALIIFLVLIFPLLFKVARRVAADNYRQDRIHTENLKSVQFIFRKEADLVSPAIVLDSSLSRNHIFYNDIAILKNDQQQLLRLLAESDDYYIVLQQRPFNKALGALPLGYIYYVNKKDILLSKIILRSL
ncbi:hypothetical protein QWZ08_01515 [Ferruginibacter paludis]|uniref:hypothetical protein n=1 Tax=Ferruginibacter paludis TaxID=1310417 RepID=UPI0025B5B0AD|nr:hypothetical protein [Ferruginibacter paludis]MDN3654282.1 hypothetical protein [Ferruginibacter paludis]